MPVPLDVTYDTDVLEKASLHKAVEGARVSGLSARDEVRGGGAEESKPESCLARAELATLSGRMNIWMQGNTRWCTLCFFVQTS